MGFFLSFCSTYIPRVAAIIVNQINKASQSLTSVYVHLSCAAVMVVVIGANLEVLKTGVDKFMEERAINGD